MQHSIVLLYPFVPLMYSRTLKKHDVGYARNWIHLVHMQPLKVWLRIAPCEFTCRECGQPISMGTVYGNSESRGNYCRACIYIPKFAGAYEVTFTISRRSRAHPNATITRDFISSGTSLKSYVAELKSEGRRVEVKKLTHIL
jgi:hypothetical protein